MMSRVAAALRHGADRLAAAGIEDATREARLLLAHALGERAEALLDGSRMVPIEAYDKLLDRRAAREPMAFIRGCQGFWTLDLAVSPATLIPRADSETLITALRAAFPAPAAPASVLDLGTGTGALLLAALAEYPRAWGIGVDIAPAAARLAAANAAANGFAGRAMFIAGNWLASITGRFDAILCNPPYVCSHDIATLMPEVAVFEPDLALDGGTDGLDAYRRVLPDLATVMSRRGVAILEVGADQDAAVAALACRASFSVAGIHRDLGGHVRAVTLRHDCR